MALARHTGRPTREESGEIPPKVRAALTLRAANTQLEAVLQHDRGQLPEPPEVEGSADS